MRERKIFAIEIKTCTILRAVLRLSGALGSRLQLGAPYLICNFKNKLELQAKILHGTGQHTVCDLET